MIILTPMREEMFAAFASEAVDSFARDNITAGRWAPAVARAGARAEFERLLPQGLQTPNHHLYEIRDPDLPRTIGYVWFAVLGSGEARSGYLYNIRVTPEFRGRGHAKAALELLNDVAVSMGLSSIGLHVFDFNSSALALYRSLGYGVTGLNLRKPLLSPDP